MKHILNKKTNRLKVKWMKKVYFINTNQKKAGVAVVISNNVDFQTGNVTSDKKNNFIIIIL